MSGTYALIATGCLVITLLMSLAPRRCIHRYKCKLAEIGDDPYQRVSLKKMREFDETLYKKTVWGLCLCLPCTGSFIGFALAAIYAL